jgi:hypothetical protein
LSPINDSNLSFSFSTLSSHVSLCLSLGRFFCNVYILLLLNVNNFYRTTRCNVSVARTGNYVC